MTKTTNIFPSQKCSRGMSLVEMLCVITVMSVVMGVITTFLSTTSRFNAEIRDQRELRATSARLADQFREDVRLSDSVSMNQDQIKLSSVMGTITYTNTDKGVAREASSQAGARQRDGFWLPDDWRATWRRTEPLVTLTLRPEDPEQDDENASLPQSDVVIQACLAGDLPQRDSR